MESKPGVWKTLAFFVAAWVASVGASSAVTDPLDRPAIRSERASSSVLLAVTNAGKRLVATGERGIILLSDDHGVTWRQAEVPVSVTLTAVAFATSQKGWALGHFGVVLHTKDGGATWRKQLDGVQAAQLALDAARSQAREDNPEEVKRLITEAQLLVDDGPDKPFLDLYFENERSGLIVGAYNLAFHTDDGGQTWQPWLDRVENPMGLHLYGIAPANGDLYLAGEQGLFLRADRAVDRFLARPTPYPGSYFGVMTTPEEAVLIFGLRGNAFRSGDRGESWQRIETGVPVSVTAGTVLADGTLVLATQAGVVLASRDQGKSFAPIPLEAPSPFADLTQATDGSLVLVGLRGVTRVANPIPAEAGGRE